MTGLLPAGAAALLLLALGACGDPAMRNADATSPNAQPAEPTVTGAPGLDIDQEDADAGLNTQRPDGIQDVEPEDGGNAGTSSPWDTEGPQPKQ